MESTGVDVFAQMCSNTTLTLEQKTAIDKLLRSTIERTVHGTQLLCAIQKNKEMFQRLSAVNDNEESQEAMISEHVVEHNILYEKLRESEVEWHDMAFNFHQAFSDNADATYQEIMKKITEGDCDGQRD